MKSIGRVKVKLSSVDIYFLRAQTNNYKIPFDFNLDNQRIIKELNSSMSFLATC